MAAVPAIDSEDDTDQLLLPADEAPFDDHLLLIKPFLFAQSPTNELLQLQDRIGGKDNWRHSCGASGVVGLTRCRAIHISAYQRNSCSLINFTEDSIFWQIPDLLPMLNLPQCFINNDPN